MINFTIKNTSYIVFYRLWVCICRMGYTEQKNHLTGGTAEACDIIAFVTHHPAMVSDRSREAPAGR